MSKVMLIIDKPKACQFCPCFQGEDVLNAYCGETKKVISFKDEKFKGWVIPDWCPLREIPEKRKERKISEYEFGKIGYAFANGWNACLKAILGE